MNSSSHDTTCNKSKRPSTPPTPPKPLTGQQHRILEFICSTLRERGSPPKWREIASKMGFQSTNAVNDHLRALERKGWIRLVSTQTDFQHRSNIFVLHSSDGDPIILGIPANEVEELLTYLSLRRAARAQPSQCDILRTMNASEKLLSLWYRTGAQDAANVMDPSDLEHELGSRPAAEAIEKYLLEGYEPEDFAAGLDFPSDASRSDKKRLLREWARGWADFASKAMQTRFLSRAKERIFFEGPQGLRETGYYVFREDVPPDGPYSTRRSAESAAERIEEEEESRPR